MFHILGMHNHITPVILITRMELLKMMNLILPPIIAMMSRSRSKIRQYDFALRPLLPADPVRIPRAYHLPHSIPDLVGGFVARGRRTFNGVQPVRAYKLVAREETVVVEVVQGEERARVVVEDVVLGDHVALCPREGGVRVVVGVVEAAAVRERQGEEREECGKEMHFGIGDGGFGGGSLVLSASVPSLVA